MAAEQVFFGVECGDFFRGAAEMFDNNVPRDCAVDDKVFAPTQKPINAGDFFV